MSQMTRQHFAIIADAVKESKVFSPSQREAFAQEMAIVLAETNDNFNEERFLKACVPPQD